MEKGVIIGITVAVAVFVVLGGIGAAFATQFAINETRNNGQVMYYGNGGLYNGSESIGSATTEALPNMFTCTDKVFVGWNTKADGTGKWYDPGENVRIGMDLYAQWTKYKLTIQDITFILYGLSFYKMVDGQMTKITTFEIPLDDSGHDTLYFGEWDQGTLAVIGIAIEGDVNGTRHICDFFFDPIGVCSMSADGKYVKMDLTYSDNITLETNTR